MVQATDEDVGNDLRLYTLLGATLFLFAFVLAARALVLVFRHTVRADRRGS